jgi:hypothetical protein
MNVELPDPDNRQKIATLKTSSRMISSEEESNEYDSSLELMHM